MKWLFLLLCLGAIVNVAAQQEMPTWKKLSPSLVKLKASGPIRNEQTFFVVVEDAIRFKKFLIEGKLTNLVVTEYQPTSLFVIRTHMAVIDSVFFPSSLVKFIDVVRKPFEETMIDGFDLGANRINLVHSRFKDLNGNGIVVSVKENRPDTNDIDLKGRIRLSPSVSPVITSHANIMSTIIGGGGNTFYTGKGAAWGSTISSSNFASLLPDADADYNQLNISVQNHSYGTGIENYYGADASAYDASTISNPSLVHVFSSGNSGDKTSTVGRYSGIGEFANLTGSFKMAKNIITVGAADSFGTVPLLSSKGPAYDGRVRPELVAFAKDGSSGAAALVSGTVLLLQQAYKEKNAGQLPSSALIRSILLNSADDVGSKGIDYHAGFGSLNGYAAMETILQSRYISGSLSQGQARSHVLQIPPNSTQLKITITWNDIPANPNQASALVNDIDMKLIHRATGDIWQPWVLNSFPAQDSLRQLPSRKTDRLNNVEQITIDSPQPGDYDIEVTGYHIGSASQPYFISYQFDLADEFRWEFPTSQDILEGNNDNILRWKSTFDTNTGRLSYSLDSGKTWNLVSSSVDLRESHHKWTAPAGFLSTLFKMEIDHQQFLSDNAVLSERLLTGVGFNCLDSFAIHWNRAPGAKTYTVFQLGTNYLEPLRTVNDTDLVLSKSINPSVFYAVAPNMNGQLGMKSYAFNYSTQGVGCYIRNFLVDLINNSAVEIKLELGTYYGVKEVTIEKLTKNGFQAVQTTSGLPSLQYSYTDLALLKGENTYRSKILLQNGSVLYTKTETLHFFAGTSYLVYPNPARTDFQIVTKDPENLELIVYNSLGQQIFIKKITMPVQRFSLHQLNRGSYFIVIMQKNSKVFRSTLIIQ